VSEAILDVGLQTTVVGSRIYAALKGVIDAGLEVPASNKVFPPTERLSGAHITNFFLTNKSSVQFSDYKKKNLDLTKLQQEFENYKKKIMSG